jgi:uncharacterized protein (DUF3820 family)
MLYLKDKGDVWSITSDDGKFVLFEDGTEKELQTSDLVVAIGKYKGMNLSDVSDRWYLEWAQKTCLEKGDECTANRLQLRIDELRE